jgi:hypothetical protein
MGRAPDVGDVGRDDASAVNTAVDLAALLTGAGLIVWLTQAPSVEDLASRPNAAQSFWAGPGPLLALPVIVLLACAVAAVRRFRGGFLELPAGWAGRTAPRWLVCGAVLSSAVLVALFLPRIYADARVHLSIEKQRQRQLDQINKAKEKSDQALKAAQALKTKDARATEEKIKRFNEELKKLEEKARADAEQAHKGMLAAQSKAEAELREANAKKELALKEAEEERAKRRDETEKTERSRADARRAHEEAERARAQLRAAQEEAAWCREEAIRAAERSERAERRAREVEDRLRLARFQALLRSAGRRMRSRSDSPDVIAEYFRDYFVAVAAFHDPALGVVLADAFEGGFDDGFGDDYELILAVGEAVQKSFPGGRIDPEAAKEAIQQFEKWPDRERRLKAVEMTRQVLETMRQSAEEADRTRIDEVLSDETVKKEIGEQEQFAQLLEAARSNWDVFVTATPEVGQLKELYDQIKKNYDRDSVRAAVLKVARERGASETLIGQVEADLDFKK